MSCSQWKPVMLPEAVPRRIQACSDLLSELLLGGIPVPIFVPLGESKQFKSEF